MWFIDDKSRRIRNVGNLFSVSFSRLLTRYSAVTLRASCTGQPREMVNLFCAPMKSMTTPQRIEKALDRLHQRYGVSGGLTSEPKIMAVRHGVKVSFNATSLKLYNEDLNTLEVYAYAHDEYEKLSGQLLLDTANRLPNVLKRRYLDYLDKNNISLN